MTNATLHQHVHRGLQLGIREFCDRQRTAEQVVATPAINSNTVLKGSPDLEWEGLVRHRLDLGACVLRSPPGTAGLGPDDIEMISCTAIGNCSVESVA